MINVTKTYLPNINKYQSYIEKIFESGWLTNNGQFTKELQRRLSEYLGVKNLLLVSNGTISLQLAYKLLELKGDVLTTPFSFVATTSSLVWEGLNPIFVDINKETFNIDENLIEHGITPNTTAIVATHVFGNPCNINKIEKIAQKHNLKIIYDAAHAFGVNYKNTNILNYGDISSISFHSTKLFHTIEGGALIIKDDALYEKAKLMINFGIPGPDKITELGINAKMNEFQAAMGLCVLDDMSDIIAKRKKIFDFYTKELINIRDVQLQLPETGSTQNYSYFPVVFKTEDILQKIKEEFNKNNIYPRRYFYPSLETLPYVNKPNNIIISSDLSKRILCLPIYDSLDINAQKSIINIIYKFCS